MADKNETCQEMEPLLDSFHDSELDDAGQESVRSHIDQCAGCRSKLADIERVAKSVASLPRLEMEREIDIDSLLAGAEDRAKRKNNVRYIWAAAAAAVAVFVFVIYKGGGDAGYPTVASHDRQTVDQPKEPGVEDSKATVIARDVQEEVIKPDVVKPDNPQTIVAVDKAVDKPASKKDDKASSVIAVEPKQEPADTWQEERDLFGGGRVAVALLSDDIDDGFADAVGFDTDEDGLYLIRM